MSIIYIYFQIQVTEKYSTAMCYTQLGLGISKHLKGRSREPLCWSIFRSHFFSDVFYIIRCVVEDTQNCRHGGRKYGGKGEPSEGLGNRAVDWRCARWRGSNWSERRCSSVDSMKDSHTRWQRIDSYWQQIPRCWRSSWLREGRERPSCCFQMYQVGR